MRLVREYIAPYVNVLLPSAKNKVAFEKTDEGMRNRACTAMPPTNRGFSSPPLHASGRSKHGLEGLGVKFGTESRSRDRYYYYYLLHCSERNDFAK